MSQVWMCLAVRGRPTALLIVSAWLADIAPDCRLASFRMLPKLMRGGERKFPMTDICSFTVNENGFAAPVASPYQLEKTKPVPSVAPSCSVLPAS